MICPRCGREIGDAETKECACGFFDKSGLIDATVVMKPDVILNRIQNDLEITKPLDPNNVTPPKAQGKTLPMGDGTVEQQPDMEKTVPMKHISDSSDGVCGAVVGKCKIEKYVGKGGMGLVYRGRHTSLDIPVAMKFLLTEYADTPEFVQRFYREAQVAAKINHQNVVRVYDCGSEGDKLYIIMEYIDGGDLSDVLAKGLVLNFNQVIDMGLAVCSALVEAEKFHVIHRDIKPENIMVTSDGVYKLADLGLAKQLDNVVKTELALTVENVCMGSPLYMSPEQAVDAKNCDVRTDVYSFGCSLFALLVGRPPYDGDNWQEVVCNHAVSPIPRVKAFNSEIPNKLDSIIFKCMQKKPVDRYSSAKELYDDLLSMKSAGGNTPTPGNYSSVGTVVRSGVVPPSVTTYRTETKILTSAYNTSANEFICSSCGKECAARSMLKYTCSHDACKKLICMDCWMRNGVRTCSEHSN